MKTKLAGLLLLAALCLTSSMAYSQVSKFRTTEVAHKSKTSENRWTDWSEFKEVSLLVVFDFDKERITVYSENTQTYDVISNGEEETDEDGDVFLPFTCIDEDGLQCIVRIAKLHSRGGALQMYVDFDDFMFVYNLRDI